MTTQENPEGWPFSDAPNVTCLTVKAVIENGGAIHFVTHDTDDGGWQFHGSEPSSIDDALVVSLESMWRHDASIAELVDLPEGWQAWRDAPGEPWERSETVIEMDSFECATCNESHDGPPLDVGYQYPDPYLMVPEEECEKRCDVTNDLCSIDDSSFFVHGILEIPLNDHDDRVALGVWGEVSKDDYEHFVKRYDHAERAKDPAIKATLATTLDGIDKTVGVPVEIKIVDPDERPRIRVLDANHALGARQAGGLSLQAWFGMLHGLNVME